MWFKLLILNKFVRWLKKTNNRNWKHQSTDALDTKSAQQSDELTFSVLTKSVLFSVRHVYQRFPSPITKSLQLPHIPVTAFSQTDLFLVWIYHWQLNLDPHRNLSNQSQSQARTNVDMSTCSREAALSSLPKSAHVDWNWPISREKYLKIDCNKNCQVLVKSLNFMAGMTRRFVSAKRLIRYFSNSSRLVEHRAQSPVREVKMLAVWPSIAEGFPTWGPFLGAPVITGPVKLFCFPFQRGVSKVLNIIQ